jgi:hypothetical protein
MASARPLEALETYLHEVRSRLHGLSASEVSEIVQELRSHVLDAVSGDASEARIADALRKLGSAQEIARMNMSMRVATRSLTHRSPLRVLHTLVRLAGLTVRGAIVLFISLVGYGFAASWLITALAKPLLPREVGLWMLPDKNGDLSFSLGSHGLPTVGHDLLGWWIVPIGLLVGFAAAYLTYRFDLAAIRRMAARRLGGNQITSAGA